MYERSAIVLERYLEKYFGFDKDNNLKQNYDNYENIVKEVKKYQEIVDEEEELIEKFDEIASEIEHIQLQQMKLSNSNQKMEELRIQLFSDLSETPKEIGIKLEKIEAETQKNNKKLEALSQEFIKNLTIFIERQKERNKCTRKRRVEESNYIAYIESVKQVFNQVNAKYVKTIRDFIETDQEEVVKDLYNLMIKNGKNEKIGFNKDVISNAIDTRIETAKKEVECYLEVYDRTKKLFQEVENEDVKINKFEKTLKDTVLKLKFLEAENEYIFAFLDYERLTVINGQTAHKKMMEDACTGFERDIIQINQLYELLLKEISGKATQKAYDELYNKDYLKQINESEKKFAKEANNIKIKMGTVINSNYWRIEGVKDVYTVFQEEVRESFGKELVDIEIEEIETEGEKDSKKKGRTKAKKETEKQEEEKEIDPREEIERLESLRMKTKQQSKKKTTKTKFKMQELEDEEIKELPKAMKNMSKKKTQKTDKAEKIMENTRKKKVEELKKTQENEKSKGILNKLFKK